MEKIYLRDVLGLVWAARFFMIISVTVCLLISCILLILARPQYEAFVTLIPTHANQYALQTGNAGQGIASSMAGQLLGVGNNKDTQSTEQFAELMKSPFIVTLIDQRYHIIPHIFPAQWNAAENHWIHPSGAMVDIKNAIKSVLHLPMWTPPGAYEASIELASRTTVDISEESGTVHIAIRDQDSDYAAFLLNTLYETTDGLLRQRARERSDEHIAYIQRQLASVNYTENRQSLGTLLTAELGQQLLINSNTPYVLEKLSPITKPPKPVSPKILTYILVGTFLGIMIGFVLSLLDRKYPLANVLRVSPVVNRK